VALRLPERTRWDPQTDASLRELLTTSRLLAAPVLPPPWKDEQASGVTAGTLPEGPDQPGPPGSPSSGIVPQWGYGVPPRPVRVAGLSTLTDAGNGQPDPDPGQPGSAPAGSAPAGSWTVAQAAGQARTRAQIDQRLQEVALKDPPIGAIAAAQIEAIELRDSGVPVPPEILRRIQDLVRLAVLVDAERMQLAKEDLALEYDELVAQRDLLPPEETMEIDGRLDEIVETRARMALRAGEPPPAGAGMHPQMQQRVAAEMQRIDAEWRARPLELRKLETLVSFGDHTPERLWARVQSIHDRLDIIDDELRDPERAAWVRYEGGRFESDPFSPLPDNAALGLERAVLQAELELIHQQVPVSPELLNLPRVTLQERAATAQAKLDALTQQRAQELGDPPDLTDDTGTRQDAFQQYEYKIRPLRRALGQLHEALKRSTPLQAPNPPSEREQGTQLVPDETSPDPATKHAGGQAPRGDAADASHLLQADQADAAGGAGGNPASIPGVDQGQLAESSTPSDAAVAGGGEPTPPGQRNPVTAATDSTPQSSPLEIEGVRDAQLRGRPPVDQTASRTPSIAQSLLPASQGRVRSGIGLGGAGRPGKNRGDVLEQLQPTVKGAAANHVQGDVGVPVVDPVPTAASGDDWEDDHAETVHETGFQQRAAQGETAHGAHGPGAFVLHLPHGLDGILGDQLRVRPRQRLRQGGREDDLRQARQGICTRLTVGGQPGHDPIGVCAHQDGVVRFRVVSQPGEVLGPFQAPPAGPALGGPVSIERGDEVDDQFWHLRLLSVNW
jgi:hypothetical protein